MSKVHGAKSRPHRNTTMRTPYLLPFLVVEREAKIFKILGIKYALTHFPTDNFKTLVDNIHFFFILRL